MLAKLIVKNYALIQELELNLSADMSVITGETGAGKSIILGALKLVLGERADTKALFDHDKKCIVEGQFDIQNYQLKSFFNKHDLDYSEQCILRREILPSAKSRAFVNDTPVNLTVLKEIGEQLLDIHSQHDNLSFKDTTFQFDLVDAFAGLLTQRQTYFELYKQYISLSKELEQLIEEEKKSKLDLDYFQFQLNELEEAQLKEGELAQLEEELTILEKSDDVRQVVSSIESALNGEGAVLSNLQSAVDASKTISEIHERLGEMHNQLNSAYLELKDVSEQLDDADNLIDSDPERLQIVTERVSMLNSLLFKHRLQNETELITLQSELEGKVTKVNSLDVQIEEKQILLNQLKSDLTQKANQLLEGRQLAIKELKTEIEENLSHLAMSESTIKFDIHTSDDLNQFGNCDLDILFSANKGGQLQSIHKVASGGELSRLMLTLKSILSQKKRLPSIIFDEIDTGVSGEIASKMGSIMRQMANNMQVVSITHLPQVAAKGKHHFTVYKQVEGQRTISHIKELGGEERIAEIAKMLSGETVGESAMASARELMISVN